MTSLPQQSSSSIRSAYTELCLSDSIRKAKVACVLVFILMPIGYLLDYVVYREQAGYLLMLRLMTSAGAAVVWAALHAPGLRPWQYRAVSAGWYLVPAFFINLMIYATEGASSPYYVGLILVILAVSSVVQASLRETIVAVCLISLMYVLVCVVTPRPPDWRLFVNNSFFIFYTASIVITGNFLYNRLRFREFAQRFELERNRTIIEENNRKLVELDQAKSRFFANISHELRTPLTLLLAPLDTLRTRFGALMDKEGEELLATMRDNGMRLLKLINDLLDLVRLEEGRVKIERSAIDIETFARGIASSVHHTATTREVELVVDIEPDLPAVVLDRDKLEKIILNLLFNALKFTEPGGRVSLRVTRQHEQLVFSVSDTGIGISKENLAHLFQRFWQADGSSQRKHQGAGIGLSLVKEFTEAQGGSVEVESEPGQGTTFRVHLPLVEAPGAASHAVRPEAADAGPPASEEDSWLQSLYREAQLSPAGGERALGRTAVYARSGLKRSTVLVADDEPDMLRFVRSQLGQEHRVVSAKNGREAVDLAIREQPAVVVLDMMMPGMDGIEACSAIRKNQATAHVPVIMLTARADEDTKLAALAAGANDFIVKPFSVTELHVRVRNLIESYHSRLDLANQNQTLEDTLELLRDTEMQLLQSEKLASLGELSAGMSHEVKNPLNYALTGVYALRNRADTLPVAEREEYDELVLTVEEGIRRVLETVNTLRELVHPHVENRQDFRLLDVLDAALRLLRAEWSSRVTVHKSVHPSATLHANKSMVLLVFLNLLKNALDALHEKHGEDGSPELWLAAESDGERMVIRIRDNGPGISKEHQSTVFDILGMGDHADAEVPEPSSQPGRVFKHFFSTKAPGCGMGMGLSICRRIVRAHDGRISFRTEPGQMCEFVVEFPVRQPAEVMT